MEKNATVGNNELTSNEEEKYVEFLRNRNLDRINADFVPIKVPDGIYVRYVKRIIDLCICIPAFIVTAPLNLVFAICTFFDVGKPIIYKQTRTGYKGKEFIMIKFRNMNNNKDQDGKLLPAKYRITKFGRFMRKTSADELLNLVSIIKGDMSIIGPRPMPVFITERMSERHKQRLLVKPGLECPSPVVNEDEEIRVWHEEFENSVWYAENVSFLTDIKLFFLLIKMTLSIGKRNNNAGGLDYFIGYDDNGRATTVKWYKEYMDTHGIEITE